MDIIDTVFKNMSLNANKDDIMLCAQETSGHVCSDLVSIATHSFLNSIIREGNKEILLITMNDINKALDEVKPNSIKDLILEIPKVKWEEIGGNKEIIGQIKQCVEWPLKHPEAFTRLNIKPFQGILLYGPPGCSKTLIAKALATECSLNFIAIKGPELMNKYVGESEKAIREIFRKARLTSPSIIFFDEIDAIAPTRSKESEGNNVSDRMLCQLLNEMDGIGANGGVMVIAATNRPDIIDKALLRPGRMDRLLYVPLPDYNTRLDILRINTNKMPLDESVNLAKIAERTEGYTGAEMALISREAGMFALGNNVDAVSVNSAYFEKALEKVKPRLKKEDLIGYEAFNGSPMLLGFPKLI